MNLERCDIMKVKRNFLMGKKLITESSLSKVWEYVEGVRPFVMVSAQRGDKTATQNSGRHFKMKQKIRELGYGFIEMKGGYLEDAKNENGKPIIDPETNEQKKTEVYEDSFLVPLATKEDALYLGSDFIGNDERDDQDSVIYYDGNSIEMVGTSRSSGNVGESIMTFKSKSNRENFTFLIDEYFSALKKGSHSGRKFTLSERKMINASTLISGIQDRGYFPIYESK